MTLSTIIDEVMKLSPEERSELIEAILDHAQDPAGDTALTPAQAQDLKMRLKEIRSGRASFLSGEEFEQRFLKRR